jgi:capping protein (actin filament), gelsolin-like
MMRGGISSGLKKVADTFTPRLFRVKGRRAPVMTEMPAISWNNFNTGDCFILDTKDIVFVWTGRNANHMEKISAAKVKNYII